MNSSRVLFPTALLLVWVFAFLLAGCGQGTVARTPEQTAQQFIDAFSSLDWNPMGSLIDPQFLKANPSFIEDSKAHCALRPKLDTDFGASWTVIPVQDGHCFRFKVDTWGLR